MKQKIFSYLLCMTLILFLTTGCINKQNLNEEKQHITDAIISEDYTEIDAVLLDKKIKFKTHNPTNFWDSEDDFGSDIDTVFIVSKNGEPIEDYYAIENISGIIFEYDSRFFDSHSSVKKMLNNWYGVTNLEITDLENNIFSRHIKGETDDFYLEVYCMKYDGKSYIIELDVYKDDYSVEELEYIISEYNTIIETLEVL